MVTLPAGFPARVRSKKTLVVMGGRWTMERARGGGRGGAGVVAAASSAASEGRGDAAITAAASAAADETSCSRRDDESLEAAFTTTARAALCALICVPWTRTGLRWRRIAVDIVRRDSADAGRIGILLN
jgi:hypothetical protein